MTTSNDKIQPFEVMDERDVHAYVDGLLDGPRASKVEAYLKRHPDKAAEVEDYMEYNRLLRQAYEHAADEPVPQRLLAVLNRPVRKMMPTIGKVAAVFALCALSAGGGWLGAYHSGDIVSSEDGMVRSFLQQVALNAEPSFEAMSVEKLEINSSHQTDPLNWLTQKVALEMQAPNLTQAGYMLQGRRLVTRGPQEFVELKYTNSSGDSVNLYIKTRWEKEAPTIEFAQKESQSIAYWQEGPLVYALTGSLDRTRAAKIAELVRNSMTDVPDHSPHVQDVQIIAPKLAQPVVPVAPPTPQKANTVDESY
ncbi:MULTISPECIES: hypothetical protein [unclassified Iodidimonas]|jgi:anti-sigma factor RsiW|uniref:anti-sigma factor family protein n=1 Tax=unclassified Iodidimonas TaxID=2626145 RepID=UPI0024829B8E|nr:MULTISPECIES: hypothetical protein [unclassified Iodidimonas]